MRPLGVPRTHPEVGSRDRRRAVGSEEGHTRAGVGYAAAAVRTGSDSAVAGHMEAAETERGIQLEVEVAAHGIRWGVEAMARHSVRLAAGEDGRSLAVAGNYPAAGLADLQEEHRREAAGSPEEDHPEDGRMRRMALKMGQVEGFVSQSILVISLTIWRGVLVRHDGMMI